MRPCTPIRTGQRLFLLRWGTQINLDANHTYGTFNANDRILLIQMRTGSGTNSGNWEELIVSNYSGSTLTLTSAHTRVYVFGAGCRVQVIRIPRYWDLDLVSGQITCHPWDDTTGGVLALHVGTSFSFNGG